MPTIQFTERDLRSPFDSDLVMIRTEEATECEGEECGERVFLSEEDERRYGCRNPPPLPPHSHLVISGDNPPARTERYAILRER